MVHNKLQALVNQFAAIVPESARVQSVSVGEEVADVVDRGVVEDRRVVVFPVGSGVVEENVGNVLDSVRLVVRHVNVVETVGVKVVQDADVVEKVRKVVGEDVLVVVPVKVVDAQPVNVSKSAPPVGGCEGGHSRLWEVNRG